METHHPIVIVKNMRTGKSIEIDGPVRPWDSMPHVCTLLEGKGAHKQLEFLRNLVYPAVSVDGFVTSPPPVVKITFEDGSWASGYMNKLDVVYHPWGSNLVNMWMMVRSHGYGA